MPSSPKPPGSAGMSAGRTVMIWSLSLDASCPCFDTWILYEKPNRYGNTRCPPRSPISTRGGSRQRWQGGNEGGSERGRRRKKGAVDYRP
jgi:hypothetical protein